MFFTQLFNAVFADKFALYSPLFKVSWRFSFTVLSCFGKKLLLDLLFFRNKNGEKTFDSLEKLTSQTWSSFFSLAKAVEALSMRRECSQLWARKASLIIRTLSLQYFIRLQKRFRHLSERNSNIGILIRERISLAETA